ncbi:MAG: amidohydrolase family protein [Bacillota bacterium]
MKIIVLRPRDSWVIRAGNLFTGKEKSLKQNVLLRLQGGAIEKILPAPAGEEPEQILVGAGVRRGWKFLDCSKLTVLPGLVDCHVHLALDGVDFQGARQQWDEPAKTREQVARRLAQTLAAGVLSVRDGGDRAGVGLLAREMVKNGALPGPVVAASGCALRKSGMYGSFLGPGVNGDLAGAFRRLAAAGVDQLKVLVSGIVSFREYGRVGPLQFSPDELNFVVVQAHQAGLKVMAHANSDAAVTIAVRAGVDSIEHGYLMSRTTLKMLAQQGVAWVPTIVPVAVQATRSDLFSREQLTVIEKTYRQQLEAIAEAAELGVTLGVGTDAGSPGVPHGAGYLQELRLYRRAGLEPAAILAAATVAGAQIAGAGQWAGPVEEGRPAGLIAVKRNPLEDLDVLGEIEYVILPGPE